MYKVATAAILIQTSGVQSLFSLENFIVTLGLGEQVLQNGSMTYIRKNGSQQTMKVVTITAIVRAAFRSFDREILAFSLMNRCISVSWLLVFTTRFFGGWKENKRMDLKISRLIVFGKYSIVHKDGSKRFLACEARYRNHIFFQFSVSSQNLVDFVMFLRWWNKAALPDNQ